MPENDPVPQYHGLDPVVEISGEEGIARDLVMVPDAMRVVETGMGPGRAEKLLKFAADQASGRRLVEQAA